MPSRSTLANRIRQLLAGAAAGMASVIGCSDPLAPPPAAGVYVLVAVEGRALPHVTVFPSLTATVVSDTLALPAEGWGTRLLRTDVQSATELTPRVEAVRIPTRLATRDRRRVLEEQCIDCMPGPPTAPPAFALRTAGDELHVDRFDGRYTYRRVAP